MTKRMILELNFGGGTIEKELSYKGDTLEEIAGQITRDENELLEYMMTEDAKGSKSFCFCGFMFKKNGIITASFKEPDY